MTVRHLEASVEDLIILARVFDLLAWLVPKGEAFPRAFRGTVTGRLLGAALDVSEQLAEAQARRGGARRERLTQADASLNKLRMYLRLAHHWHWLSNGQYEHVSRMVAEIGRLLGGWMRQVEKP
jgi:four helix bundle protein